MIELFRLPIGVSAFNGLIGRHLGGHLLAGFFGHRDSGLQRLPIGGGTLRRDQEQALNGGDSAVEHRRAVEIEHLLFVRTPITGRALDHGLGDFLEHLKLP